MLKRALFFVFCAGLVFWIALSVCEAEDTELSGSRESDIFSLNQRLGRGVNIIGYDRIWTAREQGRFKARYFGMIREAGFDSVRINLHPFRHMSDQPPHTIRREWLETLDWAVENALQADLTVVLDLHEYNALGQDPAGTKDKFLAFWQQISPRFKDAPPAVIYEILNEPCRGLTAELWDVYYRQALAMIRQTNPTRGVIIGPAQWNSVDAIESLSLPEADRHIIVTVHYYKPMEFTHQGAGWTPQYTDTAGVVWPRSEADREAVLRDFEKVRDWAAEHNRPVFVGEFGAYDKGDMDSRVRYTSFIARTAERFGFSWAYWQFDSNFIVYDIDNEEWVEPIRDALLPKSD